MAKTPTTKSSDAVTESANAGTAEGALSAAATTEPVASSAPEPAPEPDPAPAPDPLDHDGNGKKGGTKVEAGPSVEDRLAELEADNAFLRKQFGWPKRTE